MNGSKWLSQLVVGGLLLATAGRGETIHGDADISAISAEERDQFDHWLDRRAAGPTDPAEGSRPAEGAESEVRTVAASTAATQWDGKDDAIDWKSFRTRGEANLDFPRMLFANEFWRYPLYQVNPVRLGRQIANRASVARTPEPDAGEERHSSFFTHVRIASYTPERIADECVSFRPRGRLTITKVKQGGTSEGIWAKDETGRLFILIFDPPFAPEMTTSAEYIGSTLVRMAGYYVPKTCIVTVQGTGDPLYDGRRAVATVALDHFKGGWRYDSFRARREIRALAVFAAWINNVDQTEQNTGLTISPEGLIRHYVLDFGSSLGSFTFRPQPARLGWTRLFDPWEQLAQPLNDRGLRRVPWEAPYRVHSPAVGYFSANLDPDRWQPFYTNMGFVEVTRADRVWAARRIAQFSDEQIQAVVRLAAYSNESDARHVADTLIRRRDIILERYLPDMVAPKAHVNLGHTKSGVRLLRATAN